MSDAVMQCTCDVDMVLLFEDALAERQLELQLCGGHAWQVHVQVTHELRELPILKGTATYRL